MDGGRVPLLDMFCQQDLLVLQLFDCQAIALQDAVEGRWGWGVSLVKDGQEVAEITQSEVPKHVAEMLGDQGGLQVSIGDAVGVYRHLLKFHEKQQNNTADLLTKPVSRETCERHMKTLCQEFREGSAKGAKALEST